MIILVIILIIKVVLTNQQLTTYMLNVTITGTAAASWPLPKAACAVRTDTDTCYTIL